MYDVIIIGGGPAGVTAALRARELGASVALVERDRLGGTCTNDGCVPTRVLAHAARLIRDSEQLSLYGLSAQPPVLDFQRLMARVQEVVEAIHEKKQLASLLSDTEVALYAGLGPARFVDPHTIQVGEEVRLQAEKFILSVGGHARRINFPGAEHTLTHSDVWSLKSLPRSLAIVGVAARRIVRDLGVRPSLPSGGRSENRMWPNGSGATIHDPFPICSPGWKIFPG